MSTFAASSLIVVDVVSAHAAIPSNAAARRAPAAPSALECAIRPLAPTFIREGAFGRPPQPSTQARGARGIRLRPSSWIGRNPRRRTASDRRRSLNQCVGFVKPGAPHVFRLAQALTSRWTPHVKTRVAVGSRARTRSAHRSLGAGAELLDARKLATILVLPRGLEV